MGRAVQGSDSQVTPRPSALAMGTPEPQLPTEPKLGGEEQGRKGAKDRAGESSIWVPEGW